MHLNMCTVSPRLARKCIHTIKHSTPVSFTQAEVSIVLLEPLLPAEQVTQPRDKLSREMTLGVTVTAETNIIEKRAFIPYCRSKHSTLSRSACLLQGTILGT